MVPTVTLSVTPEDGPAVEYVFTERTTCVVGRADDCEPRIVEAGARKLVSRHHCLLDVNPPDLRVRDFGSLNGTHVNGVEIGRRRPDQSPEEGARERFRERDLADGDRIRVGRTELLVRITAPAAPVARFCGQCGRDVEPRPAGRAGDVLCGTCRRDPEAVVAALTGGVAHDYRVLRELGRGGQGVVHLAVHEPTGEEVALKVLLAEVAVEQDARDRFLREIAATSVLRHPNVVGFREAGSSGATFFFACEYCAGGSVADLVRRTGPLPPERALPIIDGVLAGLDHAHTATVRGGLLAGDGTARGLVHRDVKPPNILLSADGVPRLGDFGLAKAFDRAGLSGHTRTGLVAGTVSFMSRVQLLDFKFAQPEVDVWAAAASLYWMLTGSPPRDFPPHADPIAVVLRNPAVPIRQRDPAVPRRLAEVIDAALVDEPRIAVTSVAELRRALAAAG
jgi:hypothetical protein